MQRGVAVGKNRWTKNLAGQKVRSVKSNRTGLFNTFNDYPSLN
ncbi:MAG: hypothetical protein RL380_28, partial [Verrucomicrobiota bacterium]